MDEPAGADMVWASRRRGHRYGVVQGEV